MLKQNLLKIVALALAVICLFLFAACGGDPGKETSEQNASETNVDTEKDSSDPSPAESGSETSVTPPGPQSDTIVKINGAADEVGIYSIVVRLTNQAADKGVIEMVYYGAKGSPQEDSIVNTFRIEYYKEDAGTFEIYTFSDGEAYQNQHHKEEVKVTNTFGATLRAGNVTITYTPDGGETQEVFRADASYFYSPTN